jgi:hypothetical protein
MCITSRYRVLRWEMPVQSPVSILSLTPILGPSYILFYLACNPDLRLSSNSLRSHRTFLSLVISSSSAVFHLCLEDTYYKTASHHELQVHCSLHCTISLSFCVLRPKLPSKESQIRPSNMLHPYKNLIGTLLLIECLGRLWSSGGAKKVGESIGLC